MSWITKIQQAFIIRTGGGQLFYPDWLNATYLVNYKIAEFDFVDVKGTFVYRGQPKGRVYDIEIYFKGENCLEISDRFKTAADNPNAWTISHPMYGELLVQPATLRFDNTKYNVTKITGVLLETLGKPATIAVNQAAEIEALQQNVSTITNAEYAEEVPLMPVSNLQRLQMHIDRIYTQVSVKIANVQSVVDTYTGLYNDANAVLNTGIYATTDIVEQAGYLFAAPYAFTNTVRARIEMFQLQFAILAGDVTSILGLYNTRTRSLKRLYENNMAISIAGMCRATVTNVTNDYTYRPAVLQVVQDIITAYNGYVDNLCSLQTANGGEIDSYVPDADTLNAVKKLVYMTTAYLYDVSGDAKQERFYTVPYDTNLIDVAWKLYGLNKQDTTLYTLIETNNITLSEHLQLKQGREIIYYV